MLVLRVCGICIGGVRIVLVVLVPMPVFETVRVPVHVRVAEVRVIVTAVMRDLAPAGDRNPSSERNQGNARPDVECVSEAGGKYGARYPNDGCEQERRDGVAQASDGGGACRAPRTPPALPRKQRDRRPVIGDHRVQHADGDHRQNQKQRLTRHTEDLRSQGLYHSHAVVAFVLSVALLGADPSPPPIPQPSNTPAPANPCRGRSSLLAQLNRPTIGFSACAVDAQTVVLEEGYQVEQLHAQTLVQYLQGFERFGVTQNLEIDAVGPLFNRSTTQGRTSQGISDWGVGAKYQFPLRGSVTAAIDALYTTPNGAAAFTAGSSTQTLNIDAGTSISGKLGAATTLALVRNAQFSAFMPSVVLTQQIASNSQLYFEYVADSNIGPGMGARAFLDYGFQQLIGPDIEVDVEQGSTFAPVSGKGFRYFGVGFGLRLPIH